jgi:hypothetical protein
VVAVVAVLAGCGAHVRFGPGLEPESRQAVADRLEATLPLIEASGVQFFYDSGCRALANADGQFSDGRPPDSCGIWVDGPVAGFDDASRKTWDELRAAFDAAGASGLEYAIIYYGSDGPIRSAAFEFGCSGCEFGRLIYEAGGYQLGDGDTGPDVRTTLLGDDWAWHEEDP